MRKQTAPLRTLGEKIHLPVCPRLGLKIGGSQFWLRRAVDDESEAPPARRLAATHFRSVDPCAPSAREGRGGGQVFQRIDLATWASKMRRTGRISSRNN
jgi:hypothetical protein